MLIFSFRNSITIIVKALSHIYFVLSIHTLSNIKKNQIIMEDL